MKLQKIGRNVRGENDGVKKKKKRWDEHLGPALISGQESLVQLSATTSLKRERILAISLTVFSAILYLAKEREKEKGGTSACEKKNDEK